MQGAVRLNQLPSAEVRAATLASLARYTRVSPGALTRWQARRDPTADAGSGHAYTSRERSGRHS